MHSMQLRASVGNNLCDGAALVWQCGSAGNRDDSGVTLRRNRWLSPSRSRSDIRPHRICGDQLWTVLMDELFLRDPVDRQGTKKRRACGYRLRMRFRLEMVKRLWPSLPPFMVAIL